MVEGGHSFVIVYAVVSVITASRRVSAADYGVLIAEGHEDSEKFCIIYYKDFQNLPESKSKAEFSPLQDCREIDLCNDEPKDPGKLQGRVVLSTRYNCSLAEKARAVHKWGAKGLLIVTPSGNVPDEKINSSDVAGINMTVALISESSVDRLERMGLKGMTVLMFSPTFSIDFSLLIIWSVAVWTVAVGSYWSGLVRHSLHNAEMAKLPTGANEEGQAALGNKAEGRVEEESTLNVSPILIGIFVLCMGGMLLLLYFFFDFLVYVIIFLFVLASIISMYGCLQPLVFKLCYCSFYRLPECSWCIPFFRWSLDIRQLFVAAFSISLAITWVVLRKESYSWILQDILGIAFSINMLKTIRLPSLKICTLLLVLLFFYDIFFVFITPYLTVKGESVMVEVATGGNSKEQKGKSVMVDVAAGTYSNEQLPMVLRVPHFRWDPLTVCYQQYSLLGFGDILVPGFLVSYCHGIDMYLNNKKLYYITTCIAYGVGLVATFIGLHLMSTAQPALLYLVPATLLPLILLGLWRGQLGLLWHGVKASKTMDTSQNSSSATGATDSHHPHTEALVGQAVFQETGSSVTPAFPAQTSDAPATVRQNPAIHPLGGTSQESDGTSDTGEDKLLL